jgi:hypothetical protein
MGFKEKLAVRSEKGVNHWIMHTDRGIADQVFAYPNLEPKQKLEFERTIAPFDLELAELAHLLSTPFPFDAWTRSWLERYLELSQQQVPLPELDPAMSRWVCQQRLHRKKGRLPLERERALNRIGFVWNVYEAMWQKQYEDYQAFRANPQAYDAKSRATLRSWLSITRNKWDRLTPRQQRLLHDAGLVRRPLAEKTQKQLRTLEAVFVRQGHLRGLRKNLQKFIFLLRRRYEKGKLDPEVQKRCEQMGLKWFTPNRAARWSYSYAQAAAYIQECGSAVPPVRKWPDRKLAKWVAHQTARWAKLSVEQRKLLQKLQIKTKEEQMQAVWDRRYAQALALHPQLGPYRGRVYQNEGKSLKEWLRRQGQKWDQLSEGQREQLKAIGLGKRIPQQKRRKNPSS